MYAGLMLGVSIRDLTGGFKCFSRRVLESMNLETIESTGYGFQIEMTYRAVRSGFKVAEMPIIFEERREGKSKMSPGIFAEALWMVGKLRLESGMEGDRRPADERLR